MRPSGVSNYGPSESCVRRYLASTVSFDDSKKVVHFVRLAKNLLGDADTSGRFQARHEDKWRRRGPEQLSRAVEQFLAVHAAHREVAENERRGARCDHAQGGDASRRGHSQVARTLEHIHGGGANVLVIVDDQDPFRPLIHRRKGYPKAGAEVSTDR